MVGLVVHLLALFMGPFLAVFAVQLRVNIFRYRCHSVFVIPFTFVGVNPQSCRAKKTYCTSPSFSRRSARRYYYCSMINTVITVLSYPACGGMPCAHPKLNTTINQLKRGRRRRGVLPNEYYNNSEPKLLIYSCTCVLALHSVLL